MRGRIVKLQDKLIGTIFIITFLIAIFFAGRYTAPDTIIESIDTFYVAPDTSSIIQKARKGYIEYNYTEFVKKFGSIYKDSVIIYNDSTIINYKDSIITIPTLQADTTFSFEKEDTVKQAKFSAKLDLNTIAYWYPVFAIQNTAILRDVTFIVTQQTIPISEWKWYNNFQIGIGTTFNKLDPVFYIGYGISVGDMIRWRRK